jgi:hypothetical protein
LHEEPILPLPPFKGLNGLGCGFGMEDFAMVITSFPWFECRGSAVADGPDGGGHDLFCSLDHGGTGRPDGAAPVAGSHGGGRKAQGEQGDEQVTHGLSPSGKTEQIAPSP